MSVEGRIAMPSAFSGTTVGCTAPPARSLVAWTITGVTPGRNFELTADAGSWADDFDISFYASLAACATRPGGNALPHRNHAGDERGVVPDGAQVALVTLVTGTPAAAFTYRETTSPPVRFRAGRTRPTVVAVIEPGGFSPYHFDFVAHQHPWNHDDDPDNDIDFDGDPAEWLPGYPGASPIELALPGPDDGNSTITAPETVDADKWASMEPSTPSTPRLYRLPGTKVVGTVTFAATPTPGQGTTYDLNAAHGSKSAAVAVGNIHGTCPECALVYLRAGTVSDARRALAWAVSQPWIDVVSNSYLPVQPIQWGAADVDISRRGVEAGQTIVWAAGNGVDGFSMVPNQAVSPGMTGADWIVSVGGITPDGDQAAGTGRPVDIAAYEDLYEATGGQTPTGTSRHTGTSNAAPVVAGTFAKVIQFGRMLLGDATPGHDGGVVAEGRPRPCEGTVSACPLDDGVLKRAEVQEVVFGNVLPSPIRPGVRPSTTTVEPEAVPMRTVLVATPGAPHPSLFSYTAQGHGIVYGRGVDRVRFGVEQRRFLDALRGAVGPFPRPPGERAWMVADSRCRQQLWGTWSEGYFDKDGPAPAYDPTTDQPAIALDAACSQLPADFFYTTQYCRNEEECLP